MKIAFGSFIVLALLAGCSSHSTVMRDPKFSNTYPALAKTAPNTPGAIYQEGFGMALFEDGKAHRVGDIVIVRLSEATNASKSASTSTSKDASMDLASPTIFGREVTYNGTPILSGSLEGSSSFEGEGDSKQSNSLRGTISVTVSEVLPNGNLVVRGEKIISLNQGDEYVRISGIIRPRDIAADNSVSSSQIANAEIIYGGEGVVAGANSMGWMQRFFQSSWWPF